jgi:Mg2+ and Co2+ transporter CorA
MKRPEYSWDLPEAIRERLGQDNYGAQRAIAEADHVLLVLHEPPKPDTQMREHAVFLRTPDGHWAYQGQPHGESVLMALLDRYQKALDRNDAQYDNAQDASALFEVIERLRPLARAATNLAQALQKTRELVRKDKTVITARDQAQDISRHADLLLADAQLALNFHLAKQAEAQARAADAGQRAQQKLNLLAAFTFPTMALATVFGMNLHSGLEDLPPVGFWLVFVAGALMGGVLGAWVTAAPRKG